VTAIFSVVYGVLVRPLPYPEPGRIVQVWQVNDRTARGQVSDPNFRDWHESNRSFEALAQYGSAAFSVTGGSEPVRVNATWASREFFDVLGVAPAKGRSFVAEEQVEGGRPAVLVSHAFWLRYLNGDSNFGSRALTFRDQTHDIVGVMPEGFAFPADSDLWFPRELLPRSPYRTGHNWQVIGRLRADVSLQQARADMSAIGRALKARYRDDILLNDIALVPLQEQLTGAVRTPLLVLLGAVGFLLLVACANVANLMIAQLTARRRELAVRSALGASGWRLRRQLITESLLLSSIGGALGLLASPWAVRGLMLLDPARLPRRESIAVDVRVALFTLGVVAGVALLLALAAGTRPAAGLSEALKSGGRSQAGGRGEERFRGMLVAAQVALSLMLLIGAGLLGRTLLALLNTDPGFRTSGSIVVDLSLAQADEPDARQRTAQFYARLMERLATLPGVTSVGGITQFPLSGNWANGTFLIVRPGDRFTSLDDLRPYFRDPGRTGDAEFRVTSAGYFRTMGIPLRRGRLFDDRDTSEAPHVAVISESLARQRWPGEDPIGTLIQFGGMDGDLTPFTIVGVVGDVRDRALDGTARPTFYAHYLQRTRVIGRFSIAVEADSSEGLAPAIRAAVAELRPDVAPHIQPVEEIVSASFSDRRFNMWLLAAFGASAVVLAGLGIYGVTAFWVARRTQEIGVRLTMGATPREVLRMVIGRTGRLVALGGVVGVAGALALTTVMRTLLFGVEPTVAPTYAASILLLALVALAACLIPARRAAALDPAVALRSE
jgi:predicted permease